MKRGQYRRWGKVLAVTGQEQGKGWQTPPSAPPKDDMLATCDKLDEELCDTCRRQGQMG